ncbi:hypothetical protein QIH87_50015 (plasmid) [Bradyrhizobium elkanii]|jgi:hypothetical protein|uniref:hypothetical protein n=1 Tax=Bradyrhizobium elkanii TaxID=29448 RepID=UPI0027147970|nr:hypothetical protein [Bradyrhizobium elkanii]WLA80373.1 hypothetical protein QNJ99_34060 [Bradyrhizobium elkanii]WLB14768.1 hypothetical protein QIH87_50015 [Bradyrhizobium elkanii]WLB69140.1 hypothetical protein QIH89_27900 [Bradyrhizobium elkanii]
MFILYFDGAYHEYYHATVYAGWTDYAYWRPGEGLWLVPGTDPEDDTYGREYPQADEDENEGDENDETLEYMCDLLEAREIEPGEFRRQLRSVGYADQTIASAIASVAA